MVSNNSTANSNTDGQKSTNEELSFTFFYPIRVVGLILLWFTMFVVTFMLCLARKRKKVREEREEDSRRRGNTLHTDEGLNTMLNAGRDVTLRRRIN